MNSPKQKAAAASSSHGNFWAGRQRATRSTMAPAALAASRHRNATDKPGTAR